VRTPDQQDTAGAKAEAHSRQYWQQARKGGEQVLDQHHRITTRDHDVETPFSETQAA